MQGKPQSNYVNFSSQREFAKAMLGWFYKNRRDLPWRVPITAKNGERPHAYYVFVSEAMLQQTQVATVVSYFQRFIERFPTIAALAESDEQEVLRLWQGLGYYSRARNLRKAAQIVVQEFNSQIPRELDHLLMLPGIGRYTAGAIGSIAFGNRVPILDGNVARVLCRVSAIKEDPREKEVQTVLWNLAEHLLPDKHCGDFNQSLMELGATVCIPRNPMCLVCPVQRFCEAFKLGIQNDIPPPKKAKATPTEHRWTFVIRDQAGRFLIEQRPHTGRWAGMWQFVTMIAKDASPAKSLGELPVRFDKKSLVPLGEVKHQLTHRSYRFEAFALKTKHVEVKDRRWVSVDELNQYPMSKPQLKIAELAIAQQT